MATSSDFTVRAPMSGVLATLKGEVDKFINDEIPKIAGPTSENIQTALPVRHAVDNLSNIWTYSGFMTKTAIELDSVAAKELQQLQKLVADLKSREPMVLVNLRARAVYFSESITRDKWQPIVTGLAHSYVYPSQNFNIVLLGRFRHTAQYIAKYPEICTLKIKDLDVSLVEAKEASLTFRVNKFVVKEGTPEEALKKCFLFDATLNLKYHLKSLTAFTDASFAIGIPAFPVRPGEITLTRFVSEKTKTDKQLFSSQVGLSRKEQDGNREITREVAILPTSGWRMVSKPKLTSSGEIKELEPTAGRVNVSLKLAEGQEKVEAEVAFDEETDVYEEVKKEEKIQLCWNGSHEFHALRFQVDAKLFDGQTLVIDKPSDLKDKKGSFLKVIQVGEGQFKLIAEPLQ